MKKLISICMLLGSCLTMLAQATSLVVDNQTPGWLSSKINYGDQATVRNLKVTGYINATDLKFIGTLIQNRSLDGRLDLSDANVVSETVGGQDNYMDKNPFDIPLPSSIGGDYETYKRLAYFSFPKTLEGIEGIKTSSSPPDFRLRADTVIFDTQIKEANRYLIEYAIHRIKWYYFGENVKIIGGNDGSRNGDIKMFFLPSSLETIKNNAFASYENTT